METGADPSDHGKTSEEPYTVGQGRPPREYMWKPGQSGNPLGRPKGESLTALLRRKLAQEHNGRKVAEIVVEALIKGAVQGKHPHLKELLDRVDGKVADRTQIEGTAGPGLIIHVVRRNPGEPAAPIAGAPVDTEAVELPPGSLLVEGDCWRNA